MKNAEIKYNESNHGALYVDGVKVGDLKSDAIRDDCGTRYFAYVTAGEDEIRIEWETTEDWETAESEFQEALKSATDESGRISEMPDLGILDDQSNACDWDSFIVRDESGAKIAASVNE